MPKKIGNERQMRANQDKQGVKIKLERSNVAYLTSIADKFRIKNSDGQNKIGMIRFVL